MARCPDNRFAPAAEGESHFHIERYHSSRNYALYDHQGQAGQDLVVVTVYRRGAEAVKARLEAAARTIADLQRQLAEQEVAMEVAIHLPDDVAAAVPWEDVPRHLLEQIALEGYQEGWLSEEQVRRLLGYETRLEVHGFLADHAVPLRYTLEHLEQDREAHRQLGF